MKRNKRALTLLEIMVVIFIIGIISTVIGVNMKGSLEEGKAFKSEKGSKQIYEILMLEISKGSIDPEDMNASQIVEVVKSSGFTSDPEKLLQDGWGKPYQFFKTEDASDVRIVSDSFAQYLRKKGQKVSDIRKKYPWMDSTGCIELNEAK